MNCISLNNIAKEVQGTVISSASGNPEVADIFCDSRKVKAGGLFCAVSGEKVSGRGFAQDAVDRGAVALMSENVIEDVQVPQLIVNDVRKSMALAARLLSSNAVSGLCLVGVTGTNGKTTTSAIIETLLTEAGQTPGVLGTLGCRVAGEERDWHTSTGTTPESPDLYKILRLMYSEGCKTAVMEVSSHALALDRVYGVPFSIAVHTNITQDHLDFHGNMDDYFAAKALLFESLDSSALAVINLDDPYAIRLSEETSARTVTYGVDSAEADVTVRNLSLDGGIISCEIVCSAGIITAEIPLAGKFNMSNALAAVAVVLELGLDISSIETGLRRLRPAPGRFELISGQPHDPAVLVDYAHTPDALANVLQAGRDMTSGRLWVVVGCGGDRDKTKRPIMGRTAMELADVTVITSDNPRTEEPESILDDIMKGAESSHTERIADRREAIRFAVSSAFEDDVVIIAGKGHEPYMEIGTVRHPFDDRDEVRQALALRRKVFA